tara:strand:- start:555 stop:866 length:312 start_codon:yes stop_codon:yes gene_type:complete
MKPTKPSKSKKQSHQQVEGVNKEEIKSFIEEQVINKLGKPKNLNFIKTGNVFDNRWRVDVWCYYDSANTMMPTQCSKIFHSYFIHADEDGKIINSSPEIVKEY